MRILDIIKTSQNNLLIAKLRTFLTIGAVFIGALTLSLTNGLGNGIRAYVDRQLGNLGAENMLVVQLKQSQQNPVASDVTEYNPDVKTGQFNIKLLTDADIEKIRAIEGVTSVTPEYYIVFEYITAGEKKYEVSASQYVEGLNIEMAAGTYVKTESVDTVTIPKRYVGALGFANEQEAIGKSVVLAFRDALGKIHEKNVSIVGVQQQSLLGNFGLSMSSNLAKEIHLTQSAGIANAADGYIDAFASRDINATSEQVDALKKRFDEAGYTAKTIEDQVGIIAKVINSILMVLNIFGIIALIAATFGIVNTLLMSVKERTSEIGLMKALGANRRTIFSIFALESVSIGFWGSALGFVVSVIIGNVVSTMATDRFLKDFVGFRLITFPIVPSIILVFAIIVLAFFAGALPSLKASKLDPIRALRYE